MDKSVFERDPEGDVIPYGVWEGRPLLWRVLDREGDKRLLLAEEIVARQPYNKTYDNTYWQTSTLRRWLNQAFFQKAFTVQERSRILNTGMKSPPNPRYLTSGGGDTVDKLFLLELEQLEQYLPTDADRALGHWWWVRSPGLNILSAASVYEDGSVYDAGNNIHYADGGVRPAMWVLLRD